MDAISPSYAATAGGNCRPATDVPASQVAVVIISTVLRSRNLRPYCVALASANSEHNVALEQRVREELAPLRDSAYLQQDWVATLEARLIISEARDTVNRALQQLEEQVRSAAEGEVSIRG